MGKVTHGLLAIAAAAAMLGASGAWAKGVHKSGRAKVHRRLSRKAKAGSNETAPMPGETAKKQPKKKNQRAS